MKKFYSPETIDKLMNRISFESILRFYGYPVRGTGKTRGSTCPNCNKDFNHFKINTVKNLAKCFVCEWKGNPIQFIQLVDNKSFIQAVEKYAEIGDIPLENEHSNEVNRKELILHHASNFYAQFEHEYLINRGISKEVIKENKIGFAKGGKELKHHLNSLSFTDDELLEIGLIKKRNNTQLMDYFFNCVIIPIFHNGKVVDLYGRYILDGQIKHLYLFGEHIAYNLDRINPQYPIIIVESLINALTMLSHKNINVIAVGGAGKFNIRHARQLKAKKVTKCFIGYDTGDLSESGQKGAIEAGTLLEEVGIKTNILQMPESIDINEMYLKYSHAHERMKRIIKESLPVKEFQAHFILDHMTISWIQNYIMDRQEKELYAIKNEG